MVKKLFHIADLHFRTYKRLDESEEVCKIFIEEVSEYFKEHKLSYNEARIVIVGDIVHQKITISNELFALITWFFNECSKLCPVVIIAGNHDLLENNRPNIEEFKKLIGNDKKYIGLYHAPVTGAITSIGFEFEESVELSQFDGCDAVLMGDIHHRQNFIYKGINIAYCGSLIQQDFGERVDNHGYLIWDVNDLTYTEHNIKNNYGYYVFKINSLDDIEEEREYISNY